MVSINLYLDSSVLTFQGDEDLYYICNFLELARGRVDRVTFKWQQDWEVQLDEDLWDEQSGVFQVQVDSKGNLTFHGHDTIGFERVKNRLIDERPELFKSVEFKHVDRGFPNEDT